MIKYKLSISEVIIIFLLVSIATIYIVSGAYVGINGHHTWRQSDVYSHILGFMHYKDFTPYDRFIAGSKVVFDIPIYQWTIAKLSLFFHFDPLVITNIFNYILWIISTLSGFFISNSLGKKFSGLFFVFLMATSPLILHYYSVPLSDTMSIAFSLVTITIFQYKGINFKTIIIALPFIIIATLIKSPVPFVFIMFYTLYISLGYIADKNVRFTAFIKSNISFLILLAALVATAIIAELLRKYLLGTINELGFAQDPKWYFGNWDLRTSELFWKTMYIRLSDAGPYHFSIVYTGTVLFSLMLSRDKHLVVVVLSAFGTFLAGWLTFSNIYRIHDYYELPVTIVIFLSFAVSLSYIISYLYENFLIRIHKKTLIFITTCLFVLITMHLLTTQHYISDRYRTTFYNAVEQQLKQDNLFLFVESKPNYDPAIAGKVGTKVKIIDTVSFDNNCSFYIHNYKSIMIKDGTACSAEIRDISTIYIHDGNLAFYQLDKRKEQLETISQKTPTFKSDWDIYLDGKTLTYVKKPCVKADTIHMFYLHVSPKDKPSKLNDGGGSFKKNMDFRFSGLIKDGTCIEIIELPSFEIQTIRTGQYSSYLDEKKKRQFKKYWRATINVK